MTFDLITNALLELPANRQIKSLSQSGQRLTKGNKLH